AARAGRSSAGRAGPRARPTRAPPPAPPAPARTPPAIGSCRSWYRACHLTSAGAGPQSGGMTHLLLPDDVVFTCQQSGACCRNDWLIGVDDAARARLEAVDWTRLAPALPAGLKV